LGSSHRDGTLFDNNLVGSGNLSNGTSTEFTVFNIRSSSSTNSLGLGGSIDRNKDYVRLFDFRLNVCREEEVSATTFLDDFQQTWLVDW
jgi:hypothetical protein